MRTYTQCRELPPSLGSNAPSPGRLLLLPPLIRGQRDQAIPPQGTQGLGEGSCFHTGLYVHRGSMVRTAFVKQIQYTRWMSPKQFQTSFLLSLSHHYPLKATTS